MYNVETYKDLPPLDETELEIVLFMNGFKKAMRLVVLLLYNLWWQWDW